MQKSAGFLLLLFLLTFYSHAQDSIGISYAKRISENDLRSYLEVLTSDSLEGRETGRRGQKKAAAFIEKNFRSLSLKPISHGGYIQHTYLSARANGGRNFVVNEKKFVYARDYFFSESFTDTTYLFKKIHFAGYGINTKNYNDYKKIEQDSIFIVFEGFPKTKRSDASIEVKAIISEKAKAAAGKGATLLLVITDWLDQIVDRALY